MTSVKEVQYEIGSLDPVEVAVRYISGANAKILLDSEAVEGIQEISFDEYTDSEDCDSVTIGTGKLMVLHSTKEKRILPSYLMGTWRRLVVEDLFDDEVKFVNYEAKVTVDDAFIKGIYKFKYKRLPDTEFWRPKESECKE